MSIASFLVIAAGWTATSSFLAWAFFALGFGFEVNHRSAPQAAQIER